MKQMRAMLFLNVIYSTSGGKKRKIFWYLWKAHAAAPPLLSFGLCCHEHISVGSERNVPGTDYLCTCAATTPSCLAVLSYPLSVPFDKLVNNATGLRYVNQLGGKAWTCNNMLMHFFILFFSPLISSLYHFFLLLELELLSSVKFFFSCFSHLTPSGNMQYSSFTPFSHIFQCSMFSLMVSLIIDEIK